jgi:hypothetical protein
MDFMKCEWSEWQGHEASRSDFEACLVTIKVRDYPEHGVTLEELKPLIHEIRSKAKDMIITADLSGANLVNLDRFKMIMTLVQAVVEYTKDDNILRKIQIKGAGFIFRTLYHPFSYAIPKFFRDIIVFL